MSDSGVSASFLVVENNGQKVAIEARAGNNGMTVSIGTREQNLALAAAGIVVENAQLYECESDETRKFAVGDRCELHGLVDYPELDGEIVFVTACRENGGSGGNPYYIRFESGKVEQWLNYVWEKRLRLAPL